MQLWRCRTALCNNFTTTFVSLKNARDLSLRNSFVLASSKLWSGVPRLISWLDGPSGPGSLVQCQVQLRGLAEVKVVSQLTVVVVVVVVLAQGKKGEQVCGEKVVAVLFCEWCGKVAFLVCGKRREHKLWCDVYGWWKILLHNRFLFSALFCVWVAMCCVKWEALLYFSGRWEGRANYMLE